MIRIRQLIPIEYFAHRSYSIKFYYFNVDASSRSGIETLHCPYLYSYPIGIPLFETRLTSLLGQ